MLSDRITEEADWRDGMNAFRLNCLEELKQLRAQVKILEYQIDRREDERKDTKAA